MENNMRNNFDVIWKMALLIVLIIGIGFMIMEFRSMNKAGLECAQSPVAYIEKISAEQGNVCTLSCIKKNGNINIFEVTTNTTFK